MAKKAVVEVDMDKAMAALQRLNSKKRNQLQKQALMVGTRVIERDVKKEVRSFFKNKSIKFSDMYNSVKATSGSKFGKVHLWGRKEYYHSYILRFYAIGTDARYTKSYKKKRRYTGEIEQHDFYRNVNKQKAMDTVNQNLARKLIRLFDNGKI